jgi:hypothetical protein
MINDGNNMVMINYIVMIINDIQMNNDYGDYQMIMVMTNDQVMMIMVRLMANNDYGNDDQQLQ